MSDQGDVVKVNAAIEQMIKPLKSIPLPTVIHSLAGHAVLPFSKDDPQDQKTLELLCAAARTTIDLVNKEGIKRSRPNEVGNDIEVFVIQALAAQGLTPSRPKKSSGKSQSVGYPDLSFTDPFNRLHYLECKTYSSDTAASTMRSFYLSPSEDFKVTQDAQHFLLSFEIAVRSDAGRDERVYCCTGWKLASLHGLKVDVKYEFNSDNRRLYEQALILAKSD